MPSSSSLLRRERRCEQVSIAHNYAAIAALTTKKITANTMPATATIAATTPPMTTPVLDPEAAVVELVGPAASCVALCECENAGVDVTVTLTSVVASGSVVGARTGVELLVVTGAVVGGGVVDVVVDVVEGNTGVTEVEVVTVTGMPMPDRVFVTPGIVMETVVLEDVTVFVSTGVIVLGSAAEKLR